MLTVHKFQFDIEGENTIIECARPIQPLHVGMQNDKLTLWMLVDDDATAYDVKVYITGTGHEVEKYWTYCGSVQAGIFVWHVWIPNNQFGFLIA